MTLRDLAIVIIYPLEDWDNIGLDFERKPSCYILSGKKAKKWIKNRYEERVINEEKYLKELIMVNSKKSVRFNSDGEIIL